MTHQNQSSEVAAVVQLLANEGFEGMANAMQILLNEAMKLERSEHLNAKPYQRAKKRGRSSLNQFNELRPLFTLRFGGARLRLTSGLIVHTRTIEKSSTDSLQRINI